MSGPAPWAPDTGVPSLNPTVNSRAFTVVPLLDETDRTQRRRQHILLFAGLAAFTAGAVLAAAGVTERVGGLAAAAGLVIVAAGGFLFVSGARTVQRWEVPYRSHRIRFENNPITGESLAIDGAVVARGGLGRTMRLEGAIASGEGAGDRIVATSNAGLATFRCRIDVLAARV